MARGIARSDCAAELVALRVSVSAFAAQRFALCDCIVRGAAVAIVLLAAHVLQNVFCCIAVRTLSTLLDGDDNMPCGIEHVF